LMGCVSSLGREGEAGLTASRADLMGLLAASDNEGMVWTDVRLGATSKSFAMVCGSLPGSNKSVS